MSDPSFVPPTSAPPSSRSPDQSQFAPSNDAQRLSQEALDEQFARRLALEEQEAAQDVPSYIMYQPYRQGSGRNNWGSPPRRQSQTQAQGGRDTMTEFQDGFNRIAECTSVAPSSGCLRVALWLARRPPLFLFCLVEASSLLVFHFCSWEEDLFIHRVQSKSKDARFRTGPGMVWVPEPASRSTPTVRVLSIPYAGRGTIRILAIPSTPSPDEHLPDQFAPALGDPAPCGRDGPCAASVVL